ncbi:MAG: divergent polysaccharide deacetylase family protein [Pseudomonadota bacterium]
MGSAAKIVLRETIANLTATRSRAYATAVVAFSLCITFAGCKKREGKLSPPDIHAITHQLMSAAAGAGLPDADVRSALSADALHPERTDHLYVTLRSGASGPARRTALAHLIQSLDRVATRHGLTHDPIAGSEGLVRFDYRRGGAATHSIHIVTPIPKPGVTAPSSASSSTARLAIILDDLGSDRAAADAIFALPYPITISVLPNLAHSSEVAEEASRRGYQVLLHMPMESLGDQHPEPLELRPGMPADGVPMLVEKMIESVPNAVGVNNHQGSQATTDAALMSALMPALRQRHLFFIDSRTTASTVAYDTARRSGVRAAFRDVPFLDDVAEPAAVRAQLELAVRDARKRGSAIAIGHAHATTLEVLREALPEIEAQGVRFVFASELVR